MRRFLIPLLALPLLAAAPASDVAALRKFKLEDWPRAYATADLALLDRLLAAEHQATYADGSVETRANALAYVRDKGADKPGARRLRYTIERLEVFGGDTAIVSGLGVLTRAGGPTTRYRSTNVLIKRAGRWQAVASHVSDVRS